MYCVKKTISVLGLVFLMALAAASAQAAVVYSQPFDGTGNAYGSQNDAAGFGLFAQVFDDFTLGASASINQVSWTGEYFNPPSQGAISAFTVGFYADNGGQPGLLLDTANFVGTANETLLGTAGGFPVYTYDVALGTPFAATGGTKYWFSVYPDLAFPPQWGIFAGSGGNGSSWQVFFGSGGPLAADMAFTLSAASIPEPSTFGLLGLGLAGMVAFLRRKASR